MRDRVRKKLCNLIARQLKVRHPKRNFSAKEIYDNLDKTGYKVPCIDDISSDIDDDCTISIIFEQTIKDNNDDELKCYNFTK